MKRKLYDEFKCRADGCAFTCCNGWEISLDSIKCQEKTGISGYVVSCNDVCPFERDDGLCSIVAEFGDEALPETCRMFPRLINEYNTYEEYSLSFGCPYVLDMAKQNKDMFGCGDISDFEDKELYIRENIILTVKSDNRLDEALLTVWLYLTGNLREGNHNNTQYYGESALYELNNLFLDLTVNYLEVGKYIPWLADIWDYSSESDMWGLVTRWEKFKTYFGEWDNILKHCIAEKMFFGCVNDNMLEMAEEFQVIVTEYIMIRFSCFLNSEINNRAETPYEDIRKYVTLYSRILGHNADSLKEFYYDMFNRKIWGTDYAFMIII